MRPLAFAALLAVALSSAACSSEVVGDEPATSVAAVTASYQRTVVFIYGQTQPGQNMFVRGGLDHAAAKAKLGYDCTKTPSLCTLPIKHRSTLNATTAGWKKGDTHLDWAGAETGQAEGAAGSPLDWTTNYWPADWGTPKTIEKDGYGVDPMNKTGMHTWKLDVDMDCSKGFPDAAGNRWFELKSFVSGGPGWEADVKQDGAPYPSGNHFAQCGKINVLSRGYANAQSYTFKTPRSISCAAGTLKLAPSPGGAIGDMVPWNAVISDASAIDYFVAESTKTFDFYEPSYNCGQPFHAQITKHLPYSAAVAGQGASRTLTATGLYSYTNGGAFASGQYGVQIDPSGDGFKVTINGVDMPCSHSAAGYEVGSWTFPHCTATF